MKKQISEFIDKLARLLVFFFLSLAISALCMIFLDIRFLDCINYSLINSTWMPFVIPALIRSIKPIDFKNTHKITRRK